MIQPSVAFTAGGTVFAAIAVVAQDITQTNSATVSIFAFGSAVIGWLVRREAVDRKADEKHRARDASQRRLDDVRRDAETEQIRYDYRIERESNRALYERFLLLAHQADPSTKLDPLIPIDDTARR